MMFLKRRILSVIAVGATAAALSWAGMAAAQATSGSMSSPSASPRCSSDTVQISDVDWSVQGKNVVVTFEHTTCGAPTTLHVHENLLASPNAGSNSSHELNQNFSIGPNSSNSVTVPLLEGIQGFCFVQVDVHFSGRSTGGFTPTAFCPTPFGHSETPSTPVPVVASTPTTETSTPTTETSTPTGTSTTQSPTQTTNPPAVVNTSEGVLPPVAVETGQVQPAASGWPTSTIIVAAIAVLLILGGGLTLLVRRSRDASAK